ncbi:hypothetical protein ABW20_dc0105479 [Dactylellina cionopaga]|nr:hypothetical protein ABW20_dc0105479 [Dactylellina cionopaga]
MRQRRLQANVSSSGKAPKTLGVFEELSVGMLAGAFAKFFTAPIANVVTRKQTAALRKKNNSSAKNIPSEGGSVIQDIYAEKGILGFWSGYDATLILTLNPAITFFLYETFKSLLPRKYREKPTSGQTFILAAISKAVASSVMYPISMAKARSQVQQKKRKEGGGKFAIYETLKEAYMAGGIAGMYEGVRGEIFKGFFSNGITMLIKEALHKQILGLYFLVVRLRQKNKSLTSVVTDAAQDAYKNNTTPQQRETAQNIVTASQEKIEAVRSYARDAGASTVTNTGNVLSTAQDQVKGMFTAGVNKASDATTEARKSLAQLLDPETPHVGDVSGEVGGIEWEDSTPQNLKETENVKK